MFPLMFRGVKKGLAAINIKRENLSEAHICIQSFCFANVVLKII